VQRLAGDSLRVLTWNVHYGAGGEPRMGRTGGREASEARLRAIGAQVRALQPDLVALQEIDRLSWRSHDLDGLAILREAAGLPYGAWCSTWRARWVPWPTWNPERHIGRVWSGQAVLSRLPLAEARRLPLEQPARLGRVAQRFALHRALLEVRVALGEGRSLQVLEAHLEAFDTPTLQRHVAATAAVAAARGPDLLLVGDLNTDDPALLAPLQAVGGLRPATPIGDGPVQPDPWATYPAEAPTRRLDQVWTGTGLRRLRVEVIQAAQPAALSDHLPVLVELELGR
jgi:endonuclease/exonuclease/phosphatase family metal-dependent hydrolase